ncbi:MAG: helix-turn-helix domain-containing protein [Coriobacteriia bacterium]|nr:helix-turn-helix domain-containing protein [Coriobacteriia bacterium]
MGELGDTLRARRIQLGITISQAEEHTKIRGKMLEALEAGDYGRLPDPGYVRGYISSYARYLELDPLSLHEMYQRETGQRKVREPNRPTETVAPRHQQHAVPWRVALTAAIVIILASFGLWLVLGPKDSAQNVPIPTQSSQPTAPATVPFTLSVSVAANSASTLNVIVDGLSAYSGTLTSGQSKEFQVSQAATLTIGTAKAVTVKRDGVVVTIPAGTPAVLALAAEKKQ